MAKTKKTPKTTKKANPKFSELTENQMQSVSGGHCHRQWGHCERSGWNGKNGGGNFGGKVEIVIIELSNFTVSSGGTISITIDI